MTKELRKILLDASSGRGDLWKETEVASRILLAGGYPGHNEDIVALEDVKDCIELEKRISRGAWYFQETDTWKEEAWTDYCPGCNVAYCRGRYTTGQCE